jgi:hypothetical protein
VPRAYALLRAAPAADARARLATGYKLGGGLGKLEQGRTEPLVVMQRPPRSGLGSAEAAAELARAARAEQSATRAAHAEQEERARTDFRARASAAHARRELLRGHATAQATLEAMDRATGLTGSDLWGWTARPEDAETETRAQLALMHRHGGTRM